MAADWIDRFATLLTGASPAVLTTYRMNGTAATSPVWYRFQENAFEVVIAEGDVKLRHLARPPECSLVVFEAVPPFRGLRVGGTPSLSRGDLTSTRAAIAGRYLGAEAGLRFAERRRTPGVLLRLPADDVQAWDLGPMLPAG